MLLKTRVKREIRGNVKGENFNFFRASRSFFSLRWETYAQRERFWKINQRKARAQRYVENYFPSLVSRDDSAEAFQVRAAF